MKLDKNKMVVFFCFPIIIGLLCITGCGYIIGVALAPITIPVGLIMDANRGKPYYNPNYVVSDECAKDIMRSLIMDSGASLSPEEFERMLPDMKSFTTQVIAQGNEKTFPTFTSTNKKTKEEYKYFIAKSGNHLKLVLYEYYKDGTNYTNSMTGHKTYPLEKCLIEE